MSKPIRSRARTALLYGLVVAIAMGVPLVVYGAFVLWRVKPFYDNIKTRQRGWSGVTLQFDPVLGFAPIPGASGHHVFPIGPDLQIAVL